MSIIFLSTDLMMTGKVASLARSCGVGCSVVHSLQAILQSQQATCTHCIVDLQHGEIAAARERQQVLAQLAESIRSSNPESRLIGFAQHVLPDLLHDAESSGFDSVLTRGQFDRQVHGLIQSITDES